jgi:hypothetical protein
MQSGEPWQKFKESVALRGMARALEVTHGAHGWHPHLHVLLFTDELNGNELIQAQKWLSERWARIVLTELGGHFGPDAEHGCDFRPCNKVDYLAKIGLELTMAANKETSHQNRTPFQLAQSSVDGDPVAATLWREFCDEFKCARMLTWSKGIRELADLGAEIADADLAAEADGHVANVQTVAILTSCGWRQIRDDARVLIELLAIAEREDGSALIRFLISVGVTGTQVILPAVRF